MEAVERIIFTLALNTIVRLVVVAVVMDTIFGIGRAIREHKFNSSVGIDGAIRKIAMVVSIVFLGVVDALVHINLIAFIPEEARSYLPTATIGLAEFFGLLYLCYEVVSILKNMALCGLPVKGLWKNVQAFLGKYTKELPDTEEQDAEQEKRRWRRCRMAWNLRTQYRMEHWSRTGTAPTTHTTRKGIKPEQ